MTLIGLDDARRAVLAVIEGREDYVYKHEGFSCEAGEYPAVGTCVNVALQPNGEWVGSCLIGRVLIEKFHIPVEWFVEQEVIGHAITELWHNLDSDFGLRFTERASDYLRVLQSNQDLKSPWGHAESHAYESVEGEDDA